MQSESRQVKRIALTLGQVQWIAERATAVERLAAWDTIAQIALSESGNYYTCPQIQLNESEQNACERVRRDAYLLFSDSIFLPRTAEEKPTGTYVGDYETSTDSTDIMPIDSRISLPRMESIAKSPLNPVKEAYPMSEGGQSQLPPQIEADDFSEYEAGNKELDRKLTDADKQKVAEYDKKFPNAESLRQYLDRNYFYQNRNLVVSKDFCTFAWSMLAREERWLNQRTMKPLRTVMDAVHWLAIKYMRHSSEIKRFEEAERQKDKVAEFERKAAIYDTEDASDLATLERRRRRAAERDWWEQQAGDKK